ncbi:hypothetical protein [Lentzea atacamensis]|nr:hypothetical protein [Lentzea atacamensis]
MDAQLLVVASTWDRWRSERYHLRGGLADGLFYDQMGAVLGLGRESHRRTENDPRPARRRRTGRGDPHQPARARLATLSDLLRHDDPNPDLSRGVRRENEVELEDPRWTWVIDHREQLGHVSYQLAAAAGRHGVTSRWVDELIADVDSDAVSPATPAVLGLAIAEVRTARAVVELTTTHAVHRILLTGEALRCQFSGIGCHAHWQSAPPPTDVASLVREIAHRRDRLGDSRLDHLPSPEVAEPAMVLAFLRRSPCTNRAARALDHLAGLQLCNALWWQDRAAELTALRAGLKIGSPRDVLRRQLGAVHAITRGQGVQDRFDRLAGLAEFGQPDEKQGREARRIRTAPANAEDHWVAANQAAIDQVAFALLSMTSALVVPEEEREWLDLLALERKDGTYTRSSLVTIAYAAEEVQAALGSGAKVPSIEVKKILDAVDALPTVKRIRAATNTVDYEL